MKTSDESLQLIQETLKTVEKIGLKKTLEAMRSAQYWDTQTEENIIEIIVNNACKVCNITQDTLFNSRTEGKRVQALMLSFVLFEKHLGFTKAKIGVFFHKDRSVVSRHITSFNSLNPKQNGDAKVLLKFDKINSRVISFIEKVKSEN